MAPRDQIDRIKFCMIQAFIWHYLKLLILKIDEHIEGQTLFALYNFDVEVRGDVKSVESWKEMDLIGGCLIHVRTRTAPDGSHGLLEVLVVLGQVANPDSFLQKLT